MTFDADLDAAQDAVYARYGVSASWQGVADPVLVLMDQEDRIEGFGGSNAIAPATLAKVRKSQVASAARRQTVTIGEAVYRVNAPPRSLDPRQREWTCELVKV